MVGTYTSNWIRISDGDVTTHNPQELVSTDGDIAITSAQIRWEGIETTGSDTTYLSNSNYDSATATVSTDTASNENSDSATATESTSTSTDSSSYDDYSSSASFPTVSSDFDHHTLTYSISNSSSSSITVTVDEDGIGGTTYERTYTVDANSTKEVTNESTTIDYQGQTRTIQDIDGGSDITVQVTAETHTYTVNDKTATATYPAVPTGYTFDHHVETFSDSTGGSSSSTYTTNKVGDEVTYTSTDPDVTVTVTLETYGTDETIINDTAQAQYPSVPNGYSFNRHHHQEWYDGSEVVDDYIYTNSVGDFESRTSTDPNELAEVELTTRGEDTTTTTYYTEDPNVTLDVSGDSGTVTLTDGETSSWYTLSGLDPNVEEFDHNISGSGEAYFRFEFTWEEIYPTAQKQLRIYDADQNAIHKIAIADLNDDALNYDVVQTSYNGTVYAVDVVDSSHSDALGWTSIYDGTHGELSLRAYETIQL